MHIGYYSGYIAILTNGAFPNEKPLRFWAAFLYCFSVVSL